MGSLGHETPRFISKDEGSRTAIPARWPVEDGLAIPPGRVSLHHQRGPYDVLRDASGGVDRKSEMS